MEVYYQKSNRSDNGSALTRREAIIRNIDDYFTDAYMRHSGSMS